MPAGVQVAEVLQHMLFSEGRETLPLSGTVGASYTVLF